jgi:hypothetical protein
MFIKLKEILDKTVNKKGYSKEFQALQVVEEFKKNCNELLGPDSLENLQPRSYKGKTLFIDAANAAWAQHLHMRRVMMLEKINNALRKLNKKEVEKFSINIQNKA